MADAIHGARFAIHAIPTGQPWNETCYVVVDRDAGEQIVIDPGGRSETVFATAEANGGRVVAVVLTHAHHDHVRSAEKVARHFGVSCHIHSADFPLLRKAPSYSIAFGGKPFPAVTNPLPLEDEGRLPFAAGAMQILHTPGHTKGSCCLIFPGFAVTGDTLLNRKIGRTDLPGCSREALIASVDELLSRLSDDDILYAGHRDPWRVKEARAWWKDARANAPSLDAFEPESMKASDISQ